MSAEDPARGDARRALVLLCVRENRRCAFALEAAQKLGFASPIVVSWASFLADPAALDRALDEALGVQQGPVVLRVDSPGEDFGVERELLAWGADVDDPVEGPAPTRISAEQARALAQDRGRIVHPRQWFLGFRRALDELERRVEARPSVRVTSAPTDVRDLFDKRATHARLAAAGVAMAPLLGCPRDADALRALMRAQDVSRVFVKLWHGSSASGVLALRWDADGRVSATTSAELAQFGGETALYNSLRVRRYTDEGDVRAVLDALLREGCVVEQWLPKATYDGDNFDLRVVTIAGEARHGVVRVGRSPMTNLHLGNRRGELSIVRSRLGPERWSALRAQCADVARAFARSHALGVDVMLSPDLRRSFVLEVNAFGDLLPNVVDGPYGDDTYAAQLRAL